MGITQADLAREAGVGKRTVERIEAGAGGQLASLVRMLRVLDLLPALDALVPEGAESPIQLLERSRRGRVRKRARPRKRPGWKWGDES